MKIDHSLTRRMALFGLCAIPLAFISPAAFAKEGGDGSSGGNNGGGGNSGSGSSNSGPGSTNSGHQHAEDHAENETHDGAGDDKRQHAEGGEAIHHHRRRGKPKIVTTP